MDWSGWLLGGGAKSPGDFNSQYQDRGNILQASNQGMNDAYGRAAPQLDPTQQAQFRNAQMQQLGQLQGIASGQQQGAGELAVQRQVQNALASQQAMARMARGGQNAGLAMRQGARNAAGIGLSGAGQGQQAAMSDQMNAQGLLANVAGQGRQQDIGMAGQNAQLQQQQYGQNDAAINAYLSQISGMDQGQLNANTAAYGASQQNPGVLGGLIGAGGQVGTALALHSDENLKMDVKDGRDAIDDLLGKLTAKRYRYKDEKHGKGERIGVMAQDAQKSRAGREMVYQAPDGLALDVNKALSAALASAARLHERLEKVEKKAA